MQSSWASAAKTAHPRSRGENTANLVWLSPERGSSPLTRGKRSALVQVMVVIGLIPAHAGKTVAVLSDLTDGAAHPRSRGENLRITLSRSSGPGSSPLTRGKLHLHLRRLHRRRLIPAHAGKTQQKAQTPSSRAAHPRSRGENTVGSESITRMEGLIPAHAGKTDREGHRWIRVQAHPRSRGENPAV